MTERTVRKNLIVEEDLALGRGTVTQTRQGVEYPLTKLDILKVVTTQDDFDAIDETRWATVLFDGSIWQYNFTDLVWEETSIFGLTGLVFQQYALAADQDQVTINEFVPTTSLYWVESNIQIIDVDIVEDSTTSVQLTSAPQAASTLTVLSFPSRTISTADASNVSDSTRNQSAQVTLDNNVMVNPMDAPYNAVGDGVANDQAAIQAAADFCKGVAGRTLWIPKYDFYVADGLDLHECEHVIGHGLLICDNPTDIIEIGTHATSGVQYGDIYLHSVQGTVQVHGIMNGHVRLGNVTHVHFYADGSDAKHKSIAYSSFYLGYTESVHWECQQNGGVVAWMNENSFYNGRTSTFTIDGDYSLNNNHWYSPRWEFLTMTVDKGNHNWFHNVRLEGTNTITFASGTHSNVLVQTWGNFTGTQFVGGDAATWTVTDNGQNNDIVIGRLAHAQRELIYEINPSTQNFRPTVWERDVEKLTIKIGNNVFFDTGLVPLNSPVWLCAESDTDSFNYFLEAYDSTGTKITTEPSTEFATPGGGWDWDNTNKYFDWSGAVVGTRAHSIRPVSGVAFYRFYARTAGGGVVGDELTYWRMIAIAKKGDQSKIEMKRYFGRDLGTYWNHAAPTYGTYDTDDEVINMTRTADGNNMIVDKWVCTAGGTPGTWATIYVSTVSPAT